MLVCITDGLCSLAEFRKFMTRQLDLRVEARNLERFGHNFAKSESVRFPKPIRRFCREHVLVETFEAGRPVADV